MSASKRYILDTNPFITAKNTYYRFGVCPAFWKALIVQHEGKRVVSIDRVLEELEAQDDELTEWARLRVPETFFKKTRDQGVIDRFQEVLAWVNAEPQYMPAAKAEFASAADGWVIAYAKTNGLIVVTHEEFSPDAKKIVPMPNVCLEFDVAYANTFDMLSDVGVKFVLSTKKTRRR